MADIKDPENTILIELKDGTVTIELLPDVAPEHSNADEGTGPRGCL
jgi:peptidylprolyl isomerase